MTIMPEKMLMKSGSWNAQIPRDLEVSSGLGEGSQNSIFMALLCGLRMPAKNIALGEMSLLGE